MSIFAIISLVLGLLGFCALILPGCGCPLNILGLVFGILGLQSRQKPFAIAGIIVCSVGLLLTLCCQGAAVVYSISNSLSY